jgi:hypothetical protein
MNILYLDHFLLAVASAVITALVPILTVLATRALHITANSALSKDLDNAIMAASRLALDELSSVAAHNVTVSIKSAAVQKAVEYVQTVAPAALKALGVTPDSIAAMISGEVSKVLNINPAPAAAPVQ